MATFVKDTGIGRGAAVGSISCAFGSGVSAGNALIGGVAGWRSAGWNIGSYSDGTNTWNTAVTSNLDFGGFHRSSIGAALNVSASTPTVTISAAAGTDNYMAGSVGEYSGVATSSALDQITSGVSGNQATSLTIGPTGTTTQNDELVVCVYSVADNASSANFGTPTTGYTTREVEQDSLNYMGYILADKNVSSTGTQSATVTHNAGDSTGCIATFKAAAAPAGGSLPPHVLRRPAIAPVLVR